MENRIKYAVFVMSLKKKYVEKKRIDNPKFPNLMVVVRDEESYSKASTAASKSQAEILGLKKANRFKRILEKEGISHHAHLDEAYRAAYIKTNELISNHRKAKVYGDSEKDHCVYCFEMNKSVWQNKKFKRTNINIVETYPEEKLEEVKAFYVGQTGKTCKERFMEHQDPNKSANSIWGKNYFIRDFDKSFNSDLITRFEKETKQKTSKLLHGESIVTEHAFAKWIRERGLGSYCA